MRDASGGSLYPIAPVRFFHSHEAGDVRRPQKESVVVRYGGPRFWFPVPLQPVPCGSDAARGETAGVQERDQSTILDQRESGLCSGRRWPVGCVYERERKGLQVLGPETEIGVQAAFHQGAVDCRPDALRHVRSPRIADDAG